jgi:hypothetical protein
MFMGTVTVEKLRKTKDEILSSDKILDMFRKIKISHDWSFEGITPSQTSKLTHCYHRYPAKFIPQLVEKLLDEYIIGYGSFHVNDLFMGSGTTLACAIARGYFASGTDINYSAELISRAKCTPIEPALLKNKVSNFINDLSFLEGETLNSCKKYRPHIPKSKTERIEYLFEPKIIE